MSKLLDLKAIETRLEPYRCEHGGFHNEIHGYTSALVAALRKTREMLQKAWVWLPHEDGRPYDGDIQEAETLGADIAIVLAKVRDE